MLDERNLRTRGKKSHGHLVISKNQNRAGSMTECLSTQLLQQHHSLYNTEFKSTTEVFHTVLISHKEIEQCLIIPVETQSSHIPSIENLVHRISGGSRK
mmetsp:Transcript_1973/g.7085  ORF Transcript_1973/g.7085 Transcript_1973/m.7085 type:complete len:99 (-) Transcript_1973:4291-4587(-)